MTDGKAAAFGMGKPSALIIAGASAKGPYAAGALSALARHAGFDLRYVAGTSSGSLNAAVYAAGLRVGAEAEAADHLCDLWRDEATWSRIVTHRQRVEIVRKALTQFRGRRPVRPVQLEIIAASLRGMKDEYGYLRFERPWHFTSDDFTHDSGIDQIAEVSILSSTIPVVFPPASFRDEGQFWDGGIVNNTPIGNALKKDPQIDHLIVLTNDSTQPDPKDKEYGRLALPRLLEMVIEERLARDLHEARSFNEELVKLRNAGFDMSKIRAEMKWRLLQLIEIRPDRDLDGDLVSGFFHDRQRAEYVEIGRRTAAQCLERWKPDTFGERVD